MSNPIQEQIEVMNGLVERYMASSMDHPIQSFRRDLVDSLVQLGFAEIRPNTHYEGVRLTPAGWDWLEDNTPSTSDVINPNESWSSLFDVTVDETTQLRVAADNAQDALDIAIDYVERRGWDGLLLSSDEVAERESEGTIGDHFCGGNHSRYLSSLYATITEVQFAAGGAL